MKDFDDLLEELDGTEKFQKRLLWLLCAPIFFLMPFLFLNQIFVLHAPAHWCKPPPGLDPETLGMNTTQWRELFLPPELGPDYQMHPSSCRMYNVTEETLEQFIEGALPGNRTDLPMTECKDLEGWAYDQSDFTNTAVTDNDWVCEHASRPTDLYTISTVGLILGTAGFSAFADYKGRKPAFFFAAIVAITFQLVQIGVSHNYAAFTVVKIISFAAMLPLFQSPLNILCELSVVSKRSYVIGVACVAWAIGNMLLPLIGFLINRWVWLKVVSTVPVAFVFFTYRVMPESPRWLASVGKVERATEILKKVADVNEAKVPSNLQDRLKVMIAEHKQEKSYGYLSLFSSWRLAIRTINECVVFTADAFVYYQLVINIGNMAGNIFLNMLCLAVVEGPGSLLGIWLSDKLGRRWTHCGMLAINAVCFFIIMWIVTVKDPDLTPLVTVLCMIIKFNISGTFTVAYVQALEMFPTCVRQSGLGMATFISQMICIGGPHVIYLGATDLRLPYMVMFLVCLAGTISASLLPETGGMSLPESLEDAATFGKDQKFFSFLPPYRNHRSVPQEDQESAQASEEQNKQANKPDD